MYVYSTYYYYSILLYVHEYLIATILDVKAIRQCSSTIYACCFMINKIKNYSFLSVLRKNRIFFFSLSRMYIFTEQEKMLRDNIERMFDETEPWR